jgi:hypothetical protein
VLYDGPAVLTNIPANPLDNLDQILVALNTTIGNINTTIAAINPNLQAVLNSGNSATNKSIILNNGRFYYTGDTTKNLFLGTSIVSVPGIANVVIGNIAGVGMTGNTNIAIGQNAASTNSGDNTIGIGKDSNAGNTGNGVIGIGTSAANGNDGDDVIALGTGAGQNNTFDNVNLIGYQAAATGINQTVFAGDTYQVLINHDPVTADREYTAPDADGTLVLSVNGTAPDSAGDVTIPIPPPYTLPYKTYVARISQTGTTPPTVNFLMENTLTNPVTFTYSAPGVYFISCLDFNANTTVVFVQVGGGSFGVTIQATAATGLISLNSINSSNSPANGLLSFANIEIRVYP